MHFAQVRMRRYRQERRERRERKADELVASTNRHDTRKGHPKPDVRNKNSPSSAGITTAFGFVGAAVVTLKLHKFSLLGGAWISSGSAAVIAEDLAVVVAVYGLWRLACAALFGAIAYGSKCSYGGSAAGAVDAADAGEESSATRSRKVRRAAELLVLWIALCAHWVALLALASGTLACVAVEHIYFWSTRSLLDADAILVARMSLRPILFIVLHVEGARVATVAVASAVVLTVLGLVACKVRSAASRMRERRGSSELYRALSSAFHFVRVRVTTPAVLAACASCIVVGTLILRVDRHGDYRVKLLRRNCFVGIALDLKNTPPAGGGDSWASAAVEAWSSRVVGGHSGDSRAQVARAQNEGNRGGEGGGAEAARPNVVIVVLESTTGTLVTPSNHAGVSPWATELANRGMSSSTFYSAMPNTNKAMFQVLCGMTPSLETSWVEFERPDVLKAVCLPGLLRSKLGYESLFLTGSMVGGLGCLDFDDAVGYAGEKEQGGRKGFRKRRIKEKFSFKHGAFAKVNYLGYDDHVVLNRSISFLHGEDVKVSGGGGEEKKKKSKKTGKKGSKEKGEDGEKGKKGKGENENEDEARGEGGGGSRAGGKLLTILTVGPHHFHDVPEEFAPEDLRQPGSEMVWGTKGPLHDKYLTALRYQDQFLKRLYEQLDETGLSKNTYVVVVGDHGEAFEEHGYNKHGNNVYQEGILVPFFLTGPSGDPRITPGTKLDRVGMHADIAPTVLDLLGLWADDDKASSRDEREHSQLFSPASSEEEEEEKEEEQSLQKAPGRDIEAQESRKKVLRGLAVTAAGEDDSRRPNGGDKHASKARDDAVRAGVVAAGSGIVGDSLIRPDQRGCAVGANHYGGKTIAVMAGSWKGLFLYRWDRRGDETRAEVVSAQLFDLSSDPWERHSLLKEGAGGCCPMNDVPYVASSTQSPVSLSCGAAGKISVPPIEPDEGGTTPKGEGAAAAREKTYKEACCHLQRAAMAFAGDNLRFFGRLG